ncbi:MAG: biopolymer transport protein ExbD [Saprospiraceae bacterium]|jgi:biopolymer transport protein ExbD
MARRATPEINAGSMADIAFLLLIFFLVTTTMEKESGMMRLLPEWEQQDPEEVNKRNVVDLLVNDQNNILLKGEPISMLKVKGRLAEIILNERNKDSWPENVTIDRAELVERLAAAEFALKEADKHNKKTATKTWRKATLRLASFDEFGDRVYKKSKHVVSIQSTRGADYKTYIELSDQILLAYKSIKEKVGKRKWDKPWSGLNKDEKAMLHIMFPPNISEAQTVQGVE